MVFTSHIFIFFFLPVALLLYYILPRGRNFFLLTISYCFYGWLNPWFILLIFSATGANYICAKAIEKSRDNQRLKLAAVTASVVVSLGVLGFFKYFMFFENNFNHLLEFFGARAWPVLQIILPVGISFYTFKILSYTIDLYRGKSEPARSFIDFACYVTFFPQLLAGPIMRFADISAQLLNRTHTFEKFSSGTALFILGFAKKILLADMVAKVADAVFAAETPSVIDAWFGALAYTFQLYIDFSAYSDMAIGLGLMFGIVTERNFNAPYLADSVTDFWRRWHISLSSWFRDYLYIPLGGNRGKPARTYFNLWIVFLLCGLWHGANWTFIIWGAFHGLLLVIERIRDKKTIYAALPRPIRVLLTFILILCSWVLFRSENISAGFEYLATMFSFSSAEGGSVLLAGQIYTQGHFIIMAMCAVVVFQPVQAFDWAKTITWPKAIIVIILFCLSLMVLFAGSFTTFLYFKF